MGIRRIFFAALISVAITVGACGGSANTTPPEPPPSAEAPSASASLDEILASLDRDRISDIAFGMQTPGVIDWSSIETGTLSTTQKSAMCDALSTQSADDVFGAVVAAGLNALSKRIRKAPLPENFDEILGFAAGIAFESCPTWEPLIFPASPTPTLEPPWYTPDFALVVGDPSVAWRRDTEATCQLDQTTGCWVFEVTARDGCPASLAVQLALIDAQGVGFDAQVVSTNEPVQPGATTRFEFTNIYPPGTGGYAQYITCT